jgi:putative zinc finger/helix-turn-helix YgiT family protein
MSDLLEGHPHHRCGGRYARATETISVRVSGMSASVQRELFRCDRCGDEQRTVEQREAAETAALDRIREANELLTPRAIKHLREGLGLTHEQLGALLYGTPRGVVEGWERGRYLQNRETDAILRSFADRAVVEHRAVRAGVALRSAGEVERERAERAASIALARQRGKEERVVGEPEREVRATPASGVESPADLPPVADSSAPAPVDPVSHSASSEVGDAGA